jgi:hypothetical protein
MRAQRARIEDHAMQGRAREGTYGRPSKQRPVVHMLAARCSRWLPPYPDATRPCAKRRAALHQSESRPIWSACNVHVLLGPRDLTSTVPSHQIADKTCFGAGRWTSERGAHSRTGSTSVSAENGRLESTSPRFPKGQELSPPALAPFCCASVAIHAIPSRSRRDFHMETTFFSC